MAQGIQNDRFNWEDTMTQERRPPPAKTVPAKNQETSFYWDKCKEHELWVRKCNDCNKAYFYPRDFCPNCFSRNTDWIKCSGKATLHTFAVVVRPPNRAWADDTPYVVAMVDLEEGCRMPTNLVQVEINPDNLSENISVGMSVEVAWDDRSEEVTVPVFKPV